MNGEYQDWQALEARNNRSASPEISVSTQSFDDSPISTFIGDPELATWDRLNRLAMQIELNTATMESAPNHTYDGYWRAEDSIEDNIFEQNILASDEPFPETVVAPQGPRKPIHRVRLLKGPHKKNKNPATIGELVRFKTDDVYGKWMWTPLRPRLSLKNWMDSFTTGNIYFLLKKLIKF
jgi:hypothetical protein